ncbi:MAG TPA: PaaI family thioesterase [Candidatus Acidoferrales bacterium]|jgi:uncharacterized protein (TIGR00369 family)
MNPLRNRKQADHTHPEELRRRVRRSNTAKQFGFDVAVAERGRVVMRLRVSARHRQAHGVVHGGVLAALVDTAGGLATYMALPKGSRAATVEMKINFLESVESGTLLADARVVRLGRHIAVVDCDVRDARDRLVVKALMTFFVGPFRKNRRKRTR